MHLNIINLNDTEIIFGIVKMNYCFKLKVNKTNKHVML